MSEQNNPFLRITAKMGRGLYYLFMRIAFRPKVYYEDPSTKEYMKNHPVILVSNHTNHNDGQVVAMLFRGSMLLIARDWYEKKIMQWITYGGDFLSVDRFGLDTSWLRDATAAMKRNKHVIIFPEGHTSKDGNMDTFKGGFVMLGVMTNAPVVPIYADGEYHILFGKRARYYVGKPVELTPEGKGLTAAYLTSEGERFRNIISQIKQRAHKDITDNTLGTSQSSN